MAGSGGESRTPSRRQNTPVTSVEVQTERAARSNTAARTRTRTVTRVELETDRGVFMISVAAELANLHPQTLRMYEARGLIEPQRSLKGTRLYSQEDVEKLKRIQEMTAELGLNLAGVERVLHLEQEIEQMQKRIEDIELEALQAQVRLAEELEEVRRSFRAELVVPYTGSRELVRVADLMKSFSRPMNLKQQRRGSTDGT
jgi:MerR family transcriptional regulator, heat shock protein HspR